MMRIPSANKLKSQHKKRVNDIDIYAKFKCIFHRKTKTDENGKTF